MGQHQNRYKVYCLSLLTIAALAAGTYFGGVAGCGDNGGSGPAPNEIVAATPGGGGDAGGGTGGGTDPGTGTNTGTSTPDILAPTVSSTNPADAATGVAINQKIAVAFNESMDPLTLTASTVAVAGPGPTTVSGTVDYASAGNTATFSPDSTLALSTLYTVTIMTGAKDVAGNALASNFVFSFTTGAVSDVTAPTISLTNPADADMSVALNKTIAATFNEAMNASLITINSYTLTTADLTPVLGAVNYDLVTNIATFDPDSDLAPSTTYTATITTAVQDLAGNALFANKVWSFTTGIAAAQTVIQDPVILGVSSSFAILASAAITNIATSNITGDVGLTPDSGSNITGFSVPEICPEVIGNMYAVDAAGPACALIDPTFLSDAKAAAQAAFDDARLAARGTPQSISGNLNGLTLYPGLYESGSSIELSPGGFLYLDAQGDSNAIFVIRSATTITTESTSEVVLTKGAKASNVYWTAGSSVTLGTNSIMKETMIAGTSISLMTGANLEGRALNQGPVAEAITLDTSTITVPSP